MMDNCPILIKCIIDLQIDFILTYSPLNHVLKLVHIPRRHCSEKLLITFKIEMLMNYNRGIMQAVQVGFQEVDDMPMRLSKTLIILSRG